MRLAVYLAATLVLVAAVHPNDTHETAELGVDDISDVSPGHVLSAQRRPAAESVEGLNTVSMLEQAEDPEDEDDVPDDNKNKPGPGRDMPKPWEPPQAPYELWASQAAAFPPEKLTPKGSGEKLSPEGVPVKKKPPPVTHADVKLYREGQEGDEKGMKVGMKEVKQKSRIEKTQGQMNMMVSEKGLKAKMVDSAKSVRTDYKFKESKAKDSAKEAAKDPKKGGPSANEASMKKTVAKQREEKAKQDEIAEMEDPPSDDKSSVELRESNSMLKNSTQEAFERGFHHGYAAGHKHVQEGGNSADSSAAAASPNATNSTSNGNSTAVLKESADVTMTKQDNCEKAGLGIVSICKMAGDSSEACESAKGAFSQHCASTTKQATSQIGNCEKASSGAESICQLTGDSHSACKAAKDAFAEHCGKASLEGASKKVQAIKKKAAKQLAGKLARLNKRTEEKVKILKAQEAAVADPDAKKKLQDKIVQVQAKAAKKVVEKARRVQRRTARKMNEKVEGAVAAAKEDKPKVGTTNRLKAAMKGTEKKAQSKLEKLQLEKEASERGSTKKELQQKIDDEQQKTKRKLEEESKHVARKQIRKRTDEAEKKTETEIALLRTMRDTAESQEDKDKLDKKIVDMKESLKDTVSQLTKRIEDKAKKGLDNGLKDVLGDKAVEMVMPEKKKVVREVEKMVAQAASDDGIAHQVKRRVEEKVAEAKELEREKADEKIAQVKADAQERISKAGGKAGDAKTIKDVNDHISEKKEKKEKEPAVDDASDKADGENDRASTDVYVKHNSLLHQNSKELRKQMTASARAIKELQTKKRSSEDPAQTEELSKQIRLLKRQAGAMQGDYYHKTGEVPAHVQREAEAELTKVAEDAAAPADGQAGHGDPDRGVPHESMEAYKNTIVPAAVATAAKKVAELRHKKQAMEKLKNDQHAVEARANQKLLQAKVDAAKNALDHVEESTKESASAHDIPRDDDASDIEGHAAADPSVNTTRVD